MDINMGKCMECGSYSLRDACPKCSGRVVTPHPPRFSPEDKYGHYRRKLKKLVSEEASK
ncbi:MAG: RNA-protein complex protein Nop10 [Candidatus Thermoplasmatota archaeon]|nr:RNA-protein complex protein Nop10 [Euryarchaeota archaeon]MBU4031531.1 RNA-protein complex protein Nop10 [Candidatus Thermoplasmatota archaeon]MBU4071996.1 RNA-protein complex protein Nop10 [Candidatus Thermoplasmatota archaeon]MBU4144527.1 RNA-protein complex protein Nop10 [Candidatus Thermoplasmatota archaeon]MBU4592076.1 RNA-protein complex protein Nop10 [Candidatus Thermoplasmatota archaeon]